MKAAKLCRGQPHIQTKAQMNTRSQGDNKQWNSYFLVHVCLFTYKITFEDLKLKVLATLSEDLSWVTSTHILAAHNHLPLYLQGIQCPLLATLICI